MAEKMAVLMAIYKDNHQIRKLIHHLSQNFDVYLHIDARTKIDVDSFRADNVFVFKAYKVYWGSFYFGLAILKLFQEASKCHYIRYMFITGEDMPLKSNQDLYDFFYENSNEYIRYWRFPVPHWKYDNGGFDREIYYHSNKVVLKRKGVNYLDYVLYTIKNYCFYQPLKYIMETLKIHRKLDMIYYGSVAFMFLTDNAVQQMMSYIQLHPEFMKRFNHTLICDEVFFATFLLNYAKDLNIVNDSQYYIEFEGSHPHIFRIDELDKLIQSGMLFSRKFDETIDIDIINKLYEHITISN